ncbi:MAG: HDOD domain-containing protein, partial [Candidatus Hydrogenedentes bacterium]|nr:HDOD domain-containing protein [Candidatus Hydrogenedentota bacterium]
MVSDKNTVPAEEGATVPPVASQQPAARNEGRHHVSPDRQRIGEMLVKEGLVSDEQLHEALAVQRERGGKVVENLIALEYLDSQAFLRFLSRQGGLASVDLLNFTIPREIIELIPAEIALRHEVLPMDKMGRHLTVGMACPLDKATIGKLEELTGLRVRPLLVSMNDVRVALKRYYGDRETHTLELPPITSRIQSPLESLPTVEQKPPQPVPESGHHETLSQVESALTVESIVHIVREVTALPALPETIEEVRAAMNNTRSSAADVARIIARDPALSAKVLSLANSAAYGFVHNVDTLELATTLLGLREIYNVVLSSAVIDYFAGADNFDYKAFWQRSLFAGTAARVIDGIRGGRSGGLFAAGLLHDLGRLVLAVVVPERYGNLDQRQRDNDLIAQETASFGVAH